MRVFKTTYRDRQHKTQTAGKWYVEFRDQHDIIRRVPAFTSKAASEEFGRNIERLVAYHHATGGQADPALQSWINELPKNARRKLATIGLIESRRAAAGVSLDNHVTDFTEALKAKGNTLRHVELVTGRIRNVIDGCGFHYWSDITAAKVQNQLAGLREGKSGISPQTFNFYLQAMKQFCRWMVRERRAVESPLTHIGGLNVQLDRRHDRRALSVDELLLLLESTQDGPMRFGITGPERTVIYRLAVETGLRAGEIRTLTCSALDLNIEKPTVTVKAAYSKNRRQSVLPLRLRTAGILSQHLAGKEADDLAFRMPSRQHVAKMVRADLEAARSKWLEKAQAEPKEHDRREKSDFLTYINHEKLVADFHALRHTFITNLASGGVHPKTAQALARHSTFALTMDRYSHSQRENEAAALDALPDLPLLESKNGQPSNNGNSGNSVLAFCLAQNGTLDEISGDSGRLCDTRDEVAGGNSEHAKSPENSGDLTNSVGACTLCGSPGEVAEWLNAPVSKTGLPQGSGSSNLPLSVSPPSSFVTYCSAVLCSGVLVFDCHIPLNLPNAGHFAVSIRLHENGSRRPHGADATLKERFQGTSAAKNKDVPPSRTVSADRFPHFLSLFRRPCPIILLVRALRGRFMRTIALMNQKGGVGKTTTTVNLGAALAEAGKTVCLVDLDPQSHLTINCGLDPASQEVSLYDVLVEETPFAKAIHKIDERMVVVPGSIDLAAAEIELAKVAGRQTILAQRIAAAVAAREIDLDFILLDCPPSLGVLTLNALVAADEVIIPMQPHFLALQGVGKLLETVALIKRGLNPRLMVSGIVLTLFESQTKLGTEVVNDLKSFLTAAADQRLPWSQAVIFQARVRRNIKLAESPGFGQTILKYDTTSHGAADYRALGQEVLAMGQGIAAGVTSTAIGSSSAVA